MQKEVTNVLIRLTIERKEDSEKEEMGQKTVSCSVWFGFLCKS